MGIQVRIEVFHCEELVQKLKDNVKLDDVKRVVRHNGSQLNEKIVQNANFVRGYQTGTTKRSVQLRFENGDLTAVAGPTTHYAPYLEWGTRFMSAQPFVGPAFNAQKGKFHSDLSRLMK